MPDFNRVKYRKDGRVTISGFDDVTVATWKKNDTAGWDIEPALPGEKGFNASPRAAGDTTIIEWAKKLNAWVNPEAGR
jgi:hypothetical protein